VRLDLDLVVLDGPRMVDLLARRVVQDDVHRPPVRLAAVLIGHLLAPWAAFKCERPVSEADSSTSKSAARVHDNCNAASVTGVAWVGIGEWAL